MLGRKKTQFNCCKRTEQANILEFGDFVNFKINEKIVSSERKSHTGPSKRTVLIRIKTVRHYQYYLVTIKGLNCFKYVHAICILWRPPNISSSRDFLTSSNFQRYHQELSGVCD